jgi:peptidoglycan/LPS O-acetylase OafA/YrhL
VALAAVEAPFAFLAWRPLVWLGRLSYSLYLWMLPVLTLLDPWPAPVRRLSLFAAASLSYHAIEQPAQRMRARWGVARGLAGAAGTGGHGAAARPAPSLGARGPGWYRRGP